MGQDWTDPDAKPIWRKKDVPAREPARIDPDEITEIDPETGTSVTRVTAERAPEDTKTLTDGRRVRLVRVIKFEVDGGVELGREQRIYAGPKQLGVTVSQDLTTLGYLTHVSFGYPNHAPTLDDIRMIREAFLPDAAGVMMIVPRQTEIEASAREYRFLVSLLEMPASWTTSPIATAQ